MTRYNGRRVGEIMKGKRRGGRGGSKMMKNDKGGGNGIARRRLQRK